jgi:adenosylmethionine-8-amino-7-oxononanoate aminotransferase
MIEAQLKRELEPARESKQVRNVRVLGAIGVIEVDGLNVIDWLKRCFVEEGVWIRPFGNIVYTTPPLIISEADLRQLTHTMIKVLREWAAR